MRELKRSVQQSVACLVLNMLFVELILKDERFAVANVLFIFHC